MPVFGTWSGRVVGLRRSLLDSGSGSARRPTGRLEAVLAGSLAANWQRGAHLRFRAHAHGPHGRSDLVGLPGEVGCCFSDFGSRSTTPHETFAMIEADVDEWRAARPIARSDLDLLPSLRIDSDRRRARVSGRGQGPI